MAARVIDSLAEAAKGRTLLEVFNSIDENRSHKVDRREFALACSNLGSFTSEEVDAAFDTFDDNQSGSVEYKELVHKLRPSTLAENALHLRDGPVHPTDPQGGGNDEEEEPEWLTDAATLAKATAGEAEAARAKEAAAEEAAEAARQALSKLAAENLAETQAARAAVKEAKKNEAEEHETAVRATKEAEEAIAAAKKNVASAEEAAAAARAETKRLQEAKLKAATASLLARAAHTSCHDKARAAEAANAAAGKLASTAQLWARASSSASVSVSRAAAKAEVEKAQAALASLTSHAAADHAASHWRHARDGAELAVAKADAAKARAALADAEATLAALRSAEDNSGEEQPEWLVEAEQAVSLAVSASEQLDAVAPAAAPAALVSSRVAPAGGGDVVVEIGGTSAEAGARRDNRFVEIVRRSWNDASDLTHSEISEGFAALSNNCVGVLKTQVTDFAERATQAVEVATAAPPEGETRLVRVARTVPGLAKSMGLTCVYTILAIFNFLAAMLMTAAGATRAALARATPVVIQAVQTHARPVVKLVSERARSMARMVKERTEAASAQASGGASAGAPTAQIKVGGEVELEQV